MVSFYRLPLLTVCAALLLPAQPSHGTWRILGPGGGGAMFVPAISPHDPNTVFIACDMTGSYLTHDAGRTWRMFNLRDRTSWFVFDPSDAKTMYAYGLGLMRSQDAGRSWSLLYPTDVRGVAKVGDHANEVLLTKSGKAETIDALAVDPTNSRTLYAVFTTNGQHTLRLSTDAGRAWRDAGPLSSAARAIYVDPQSPAADRTLYIAGASAISVRRQGAWHEGAAVAPFTSFSAGFGADGALVAYATAGAAVYRTGNGGVSWTKLPVNGRTRAVATSLHHPDTAYVSYSRWRHDGGSYFGVAVTHDSGATWTYPWSESTAPAAKVDEGGWISPTLGADWGEHPLELGVSPENPQLCYATDLGRTLRTTDGGAHWTAVYTTKVANGYTTRGLDVTTTYGVHIDPFDPKHMFISYTDIGAMRSDDGGTGWRTATARGVPAEWRNTTYWIEFDPEVKGRLWAVMSGTHDLPRPKMWRHTPPASFKGGIVRSDDGGATWTVQNHGMPETAATHVLLDRRSPKQARVLYVTGFGRGVYKSTDGGASWRLKNNGLPGPEPFAWRLSQDSSGTLYVVTARRSEDGSIGNALDGAVYRSTDGAESWQKLPLPAGVNGPNGLTIDPTDPRRLYLAAWGRKGKEHDEGGGIYLTTDSGATWRQVLDRDAHVYDVTADPAHPGVLYACGFESSVWRSTDRGVTWTRLSGYNFKWGHRVIPDPVHPDRIYVTTFGGSVWYGPAAGDPRAMGDILPPLEPAVR